MGASWTLRTALSHNGRGERQLDNTRREWDGCERGRGRATGMQWKSWGYALGMACSLLWVAGSRGQYVAGPRAGNTDRERESRRNTWSAAAEFVPTTQDYFLGQAEDRRFFAIGGEYARRLNRGRAAQVFYVAELRPLILEGDPTFEGFKNQLTGQPVLRFSDPRRGKPRQLHNCHFWQFDRPWYRRLLSGL